MSIPATGATPPAANPGATPGGGDKDKKKKAGGGAGADAILATGGDMMNSNLQGIKDDMARNQDSINTASEKVEEQTKPGNSNESPEAATTASMNAQLASISK